MGTQRTAPPGRRVEAEQVAARDLRVGDVLVGTDRPRVQGVGAASDGRLCIRCEGRLGPFSFYPSPEESLAVAVRVGSLQVAC